MSQHTSILDVLPEKLGTQETNHHNAFYPLPAAIELDAIDLENVNLTTIAEASLALRQRRAPEGGGVYWDSRFNDFGGINVQAFQRLGRSTLGILPSPKDIVDKDTYSVTEEAAAFCIRPDGYVKVCALFLPAQLAQWRSEYKIVGSVGVRQLGMMSQRLEYDEVTKDGLVVVRERPFQVGFSGATPSTSV